MIERRSFLDFLSHFILIFGVVAIALPLYLAFVASTQTAQEVAQAPLSLWPGGQLLDNYRHVLLDSAQSTAPVARMLWVSTVMALGIALGKIVISMLSAFAVVYFRFPLRRFFFWMILVTLMLPVEVRMGPTYNIVSDLGMINGYAGLTLPLVASATATFLFRQLFLTIPDEFIEAARIDGVGPMRFFFDIVLPLSRTTIAALFVIQFIYGWNQYLWPLIMTSHQEMAPVLVGMKSMISVGGEVTAWNLVMATAMLAILPPALVMLIMQKWFSKHLISSRT